MNPIKWLWVQVSSTFKFFYNDIRTDIKTIGIVTKRLNKGEQVLDPKKVKDLKDYYKTFNMGEFLKEYWIGILFFMLCIVVGWFLASVYYESQCNILIQNVVMEARALQTDSPIIYGFTNLTFG